MLSGSMGARSKTHSTTVIPGRRYRERSQSTRSYWLYSFLFLIIGLVAACYLWYNKTSDQGNSRVDQMELRSVLKPMSLTHLQKGQTMALVLLPIDVKLPEESIALNTTDVARAAGNIMRRLLQFKEPLIDEVPVTVSTDLLIHINDISIVTKDSNFALEYAMNMSKSTFERAHSDVIFLSYGNPEHLKQNAMTVINNIGYAMHWGARFFLDTSNYSSSQFNGDLCYDKIIVLQNALKRYDKIIWIDTDLALVNTAIDLTQLFEEFPEADIIMADHSDNPNNGIFLLRKTPFALDFVKTWRRIAEESPTYLFSDQGAFYAAMLRYLSERYFERCKYNGECENGANKTHTPHLCMRRFLECWSFPYNNRAHMGKFALLPQNETRYRFNQWYFKSNVTMVSSYLYPEWNSESYYRQGDVGVHSKSMEDFVNWKSLISMLLQ
jgi:hypothetical protein